MEVPATLYAQAFTTRQREILTRLATYIEDYILITPDAGAIASAIAGHAALTSGVHGISAFGATLIDDASAAVARSTLGLGTASLHDVASQSFPSLQFASGEMIDFYPAYNVNGIVMGASCPQVPGGTAINTMSGFNNNTLQGYDVSFGAFSSSPDAFTWLYKSGTNARTLVSFNFDSDEANNIFGFSGKILLNHLNGSPEVGLMDVPLNERNENYTYDISARGLGTGKNDTSAYTHTVPPNASVAFPLGSVIAYYNDGSAGDLTIAQGAGVTIVLDGTTTTGNRTVAAGGTGRLWKIGTNRWICGGSGTT